MLKLAYSTVEESFACFNGWWLLKEARRFWLDELNGRSRFCKRFEADDREVDNRSKELFWLFEEVELGWNGNLGVFVGVGFFWDLLCSSVLLLLLLLQIELDDDDSFMLSMSKSETLCDLRCCCCCCCKELDRSCWIWGLFFALFVVVWIEGNVLGNKRGRVEATALLLLVVLEGLFFCCCCCYCSGGVFIICRF